MERTWNGEKIRYDSLGKQADDIMIQIAWKIEKAACTKSQAPLSWRQGRSQAPLSWQQAGVLIEGWRHCTADTLINNTMEILVCFARSQ